MWHFKHTTCVNFIGQQPSYLANSCTLCYQQAHNVYWQLIRTFLIHRIGSKYTNSPCSRMEAVTAYQSVVPGFNSALNELPEGLPSSQWVSAAAKTTTATGLSLVH